MFLSLELIFKIPLLKSLIGYLSPNMAGQIAFALLIMRVIPFILSLLFNNKIIKILERLCPSSIEDELLKPLYIYDGAIDDPQTAMDLLEKEQLRLVERFPLIMENIREEHDTTEIIDYEVLHHASQELQIEIGDFITELFKDNLGRDASERLIRLQNMQNYINQIEDNLYIFVKELAESDLNGGVKNFARKVVESLHLVLMVNLEMNQAQTEDMVVQMISMTSDKEKLMEIMRKPFLTENNKFTQSDRVKVLNITNIYQRIIWIINKRANLYSEIMSRSI